MVHIWAKDGSLYITVSDTGVGMSEEELATLIDFLSQSDTQTKGIGLKNVYQRVKKLYQDSDFEIFSRAGEGTMIKIRIPFSETEMTVA